MKSSEASYPYVWFPVDLNQVEDVTKIVIRVQGLSDWEVKDIYVRACSEPGKCFIIVTLT